MRIAVLADIHGNAFALAAVIADICRRGVDATVNLGDTFYGPIAPRATYDLLMAHPCTSIQGNQDRQILDVSPADIESNPTLGFVIDNLGNEPLCWLAGLSADGWLEEAVYLCHGAPGDAGMYLLEDVATGVPQLRQESAIMTRLAGNTAAVILCGHTHIPRIVTLKNGQLVVNPGSVGLPAYSDEDPVPHRMEAFSPHAAYAVIEKTAAGWDVALIRVAYDHHAAAQAAADRHRADWARALTTGRA